MNRTLRLFRTVIIQLQLRNKMKVEFEFNWIRKSNRTDETFYKKIIVDPAKTNLFEIFAVSSVLPTALHKLTTESASIVFNYHIQFEPLCCNNYATTVVDCNLITISGNHLTAQCIHLIAIDMRILVSNNFSEKTLLTDAV